MRVCRIVGHYLDHPRHEPSATQKTVRPAAGRNTEKAARCAGNERPCFEKRRILTAVAGPCRCQYRPVPESFFQIASDSRSTPENWPQTVVPVGHRCCGLGMPCKCAIDIPQRQPCEDGAINPKSLSSLRSPRLCRSAAVPHLPEQGTSELSRPARESNLSLWKCR